MTPEAEAAHREPERIPSKPVMRAALKRLYDETNTRNGLVIHNLDEAVDAVRSALLAVPATPAATPEPGWMLDVLAGQVKRLNEVEPDGPQTYGDAIADALRLIEETNPSRPAATPEQPPSIDVERLARACDNLYRDIPVDFALIAAEYARLAAPSAP